MKKYITILLFVVINLPVTGQTGTNFFPVTANYDQEIKTFNYAGVSQGIRLAAVSLQGLVNRNKACIYLEDNLSNEVFQLYNDKGLITSQQAYGNIYLLLRDFKTSFVGAVVYDPAKPFTINLATNIAGVENRIIISPDMINNFKGFTGIQDVTDLRDHNFQSRREAYTWYKENIYPSQDNSVLAVAHKGYMHDVYRDYLIQFKIPTFWLPGPGDSDYDAVYESFIIDLFEETPDNIPVLGFWPDDVSGYEEYHGVKLAGKYAKFTVVNTWVGNYSFHSAFGTDNAYEQTEVRTKTFRQYDPNKKYVALIMIESGDSPAYMQYGLMDRQWNDPYRGQVPLNYSINPSMRMLLPVLTRHMYETATANDFFFCSISGAGYCYPFEGYGQLTSNRSQVLTDYFKITSDNMALLDLEMMGIYTHPSTTNGRWTTSDLQLFTDYIEPMDGLQSVMSGMHRTGYHGSQANTYYNNYGKDVTVHHTMTFWATSGDFANPSNYADEQYDNDAVNFLENEIKTYGAGGNFTQAMFYSWIYGPRRLKKLMDKMQPQGYEFVTLNEFDHLYRTSKDLITSAKGVSAKAASITCYPNPVKDTLFFENELNGELQIYTMNGVLVDQQVGNKLKSIDVSKLKSGDYIIEMTTEKGEKGATRFVKI